MGLCAFRCALLGFQHISGYTYSATAILSFIATLFPLW
jgi:hypothetical protein